MHVRLAGAARPRFLALFALSLFASLIAAMALALPASAHSVLVSESPEDGEVFTQAPDSIVLTFNEDITDLGTDIVVTGPDGEDPTSGKTKIDGPKVERPLKADLPDGDYKVSYRVVSADGHPVDGKVTFTVKSGSDSATSQDSASKDANEESQSPEATNGSDEASSTQSDPSGSDGSDASSQSSASDSDSGTSAGMIALYVIVALVVIGGIAAIVVRTRRNQE